MLPYPDCSGDQSPDTGSGKTTRLMVVAGGGDVVAFMCAVVRFFIDIRNDVRVILHISGTEEIAVLLQRDAITE
ncbi:hypothetical protein [uncultured Propionivibrio sp.]|uniref:hypothetical protein n=1 Tax=uncultured Propionivibrio sp. TaxID=426737 RepID=UPI0037495259